MPQYGVINEIGDLGLGFDTLNEKDQEVINKQKKEKDNETNNN
jgi:hypothetical protein